ncbi:serine hydrolase [Lewinella sp. W8]|uniref:serine hydrolase n=1 Tax=Lewinella sp. W8 TaxID=2528208 RepID=UPI001067873B|nr:serine hydrolase [Lewinella sp. W8]MTB51738.1 serine hydrolase [Lewinella sp. W8]
MTFSQRAFLFLLLLIGITEVVAQGNVPQSLAFREGPATAVTTNDQIDELFAPWDSKASPGAAVAVVRDGEIIFQRGYGMANLEYDIPNTPATVFHIASVSKQFTVFAVLLLEEAGALSLDDDIRKHIPEVPDFGTTITLRHLATHTSGMRDQWNLLAMAGWRLDDVITKEHVLGLVARQQDLNFAPGEEYLYCNTGFTLLAEVVARVSGKSFAEFTEERIFEPLGMSSTLFYDDHERIVKNRAYSYQKNGFGYKKSVLSYANVGATSLFTTVEDLSRWAMNFNDPKVGSAAIIEKMNTPAVLNNGETFGGALGQFVGEYKGLKEISHGGADASYRTYFTRFPEHNAAVTVFSNAGEFNPNRIAHQVADILLADLLEEELTEEDATEMAETEEVKIEFGEGELEAFVGEYELQPGFIITITERDGNLYGQATGQGQFLLAPVSQTAFEVKIVNAKLEFFPEEDGTVPLMKLHQNGQIMDCKRVEHFDKSSVTLADFTGTYHSEELATTYEFVVDEGQLIARHPRTGNIALTPEREDLFSGSAWYFGQVDFLRDEKGSVTGCKVSCGRVRDLKFRRMK